MPSTIPANNLLLRRLSFARRWDVVDDGVGWGRLDGEWVGGVAVKDENNQFKYCQDCHAEIEAECATQID